MKLGAWVGDQFRKRNRKRRRIVEVNLSLCFPKLSEAEREQLCVDHFRAYGRGLVDMGLSLWGSRKRLSKLVTIENFDEHQALVANQRVLGLMWHLTTMEISGSVFSIVGPTVSMMNEMKNPLLTWQFARGRCHLGDVDLVLRQDGARPLLKGLKSGKQCVLIPDEDFGGREGTTIFVPFFGVQRAMLVTPSRLVKSSGAAVVVCVARLDADTGRYVCTLSKPLQGVDGKDPEADTIAITRAFEVLIAKAPEQYMWTFRWFQSRPDGGPSPYDPVKSS